MGFDLSTPKMLNFRGNRDYVHGTTLFSLLTAGSERGQNFVFKVSRPIFSNLVQIEEIANPEGGKNYPCSCTWRENGAVRRMALMELPGGDGNAREPYDEANILTKVKFEGDSAVFETSDGVPFIDVVVAMNKALLLRLNPVPVGTQYVFARLDLKEKYDSYVPLKLVLSATSGGDFFVSDIYIEDFAVGKIYFSIWRKKP
jgi:hypothetical protein